MTVLLLYTKPHWTAEGAEDPSLISAMHFAGIAGQKFTSLIFCGVRSMVAGDLGSAGHLRVFLECD